MTTYCISQGTPLSALWWPKWEGNKKKRGHICIWIADSLCCTVETNNIAKQLYPHTNFKNCRKLNSTYSDSKQKSRGGSK